MALVVGALVTAAVGCSPKPGLKAAPAGPPATSVAALFASKGYVESEYFLTGIANSYREVGTWGSDGHWNKQVSQSARSFTTRLLVDRPADPTRFNGTVWVEWLNVTAGADAAASIVQGRDRVVASGAAWVGVSAQKSGVDALRNTAGGRYSSLDVASDALSYDIYTQAANALRRHPEVFGGARAQRLLGVGDSQSALRLTTYVNAWQPQDLAFDGFIVHSRFTSGAPVGDGIMGTTPTRIRDDSTRPVLQLQTEVEVGLNLDALQAGLGAWEDVRQPDAGNVHTWEVAGAAHADRYLLTQAGTNPDIDPSGVLALIGCTDPINDFPFHDAANAAFTALERWVTTGQRPPSTPVIDTVDGIIQRDADGNARGGLRLPDIDVPIARYNGGATANPLCALFGSSVHFTPEALRARYGTSAAYVAAYRQRADAAVAAGILSAADRDAGVAAGAAVPFG